MACPVYKTCYICPSVLSVGRNGGHHIAQIVHYDILLVLFQMRKHWPELAVDTNRSICPSVPSVGCNGGPPRCTDSTLRHTPGVVSDEETLARASSGHQQIHMS